MKYLKTYEDLTENDWNKYINETLSELTVENLIYNTINLPSYYNNISEEDMINSFGTIDKNLHYFISSIRYEKSLWENFIFQYSIIFWRKIKNLILKKLEILKNDVFMSGILESYLGKMGTFDDIAERILSNSPLYKEKEQDLYKKVDENIKNYLLKKIIENPDLYYKNIDYHNFVSYMEDYIPGWIKNAKKFNL